MIVLVTLLRDAAAAKLCFCLRKPPFGVFHSKIRQFDGDVGDWGRGGASDKCGGHCGIDLQLKGGGGLRHGHLRLREQNLNKICPCGLEVVREGRPKHKANEEIEPPDLTNFC
jgi:hypothetical protein